MTGAFNHDGNQVAAVFHGLENAAWEEMKSVREACSELRRKQSLHPSSDVKNTVFVVLKNSDFTEGRGPHVFDRVFSSLEAAHVYIMSKYGIMGSEQARCNSYKNDNNGLQTIIYNGYCICEVKLETLADLSEETRKLADKERQKLENRQRELQRDLEKITEQLSKWS